MKTEKKTFAAQWNERNCNSMNTVEDLLIIEKIVQLFRMTFKPFVKLRFVWLWFFTSIRPRIRAKQLIEIHWNRYIVAFKSHKVVSF